MEGTLMREHLQYLAQIEEWLRLRGQHQADYGASMRVKDRPPRLEEGDEDLILEAW
ncbi:hypothetical protein D3C78_1788770 [compost metagenome]